MLVLIAHEPTRCVVFNSTQVCTVFMPSPGVSLHHGLHMAHTHTPSRRVVTRLSRPRDSGTPSLPPRPLARPTHGPPSAASSSAWPPASSSAWLPRPRIFSTSARVDAYWSCCCSPDSGSMEADALCGRRPAELARDEEFNGLGSPMLDGPRKGLVTNC